MADGSQKILKGHAAPVLSVTIDPKNQYLVSWILFSYFFIFFKIKKTNEGLCPKTSSSGFF